MGSSEGIDHWFEPIAEHLGPAYLRYSFTKGTRQEVDFLVDALDLRAGMRILDVGCGPGRHAHELARRGMQVHGVDISQTFVDLARLSAPAGATFARLDARRLSFDGEFDVVVCLCQGAFGLMTSNGDDTTVLHGIARALRPGGRLALSAFNAYFAVKYHDSADFNADSGVSHELTQVKNVTGDEIQVDLWTGCYTPRELRLLCAMVGIQVDSVASVEPGQYGVDVPSTEQAEFLVIGHKPGQD